MNQISPPKMSQGPQEGLKMSQGPQEGPENESGTSKMSQGVPG
jgi:hypothetical protein